MSEDNLFQEFRGSEYKLLRHLERVKEKEEKKNKIFQVIFYLLGTIILSYEPFTVG